MLTPKSTTLAAAFALLAMITDSASAALTKFNTDYDYHVVMYKSSIGIIGKLVEIQENEWLRKEYDTFSAKLNKAIDAGDITMSTYKSEVRTFYQKAEDTFSDFSTKATNALMDNPVRMLDYNKYAPESWSDYLCDTLKATAEQLKMADLLPKIADLQKAVENSIKSNAGEAVIESEFKTFYSSVPAEFSDAFDAKRDDNFAKYDAENKNPGGTAPGASTPSGATNGTAGSSVSASDSTSSNTFDLSGTSNSNSNGMNSSEQSTAGAKSFSVVASVATVFVVALSIMS